MTPQEVANHPARLAKVAPVDWSGIQRLDALKDLPEAERDVARQGMAIAKGPAPKTGQERHVYRIVDFEGRLRHMFLVGDWWYWYGGPSDGFRAPLKKD